MRTIKVIGLFSGIGAHHSAVERLDIAGVKFEVIAQCEFDEKTALAYNAMHGETPNLGDITKLDRLPNMGGVGAGGICVYSPPCQDISQAGRGAGNSKADWLAGKSTRSGLIWDVERVLKATPERERPEYLLMEEVPAMINKKYIDSWKGWLKALESLGYSSRYTILNAADYGVAQSRKRCFCVSRLRGTPPDFPKPIPLTKCLRDYLEPEPVAPYYYLSKEKIEGLIWYNTEQERKGRGERFNPTDGGGTAYTITTRPNREYGNWLTVPGRSDA